LRFAALQKGFKATGIPTKAEADVDAPDRLLDDIVRDVNEVVNGLAADLKTITIASHSHETCTFREMDMLEYINAVTQLIVPLQLETFLRRPMTHKNEWRELLRGEVSVGDVVNASTVEVRGVS
jgi:hypothetical protein